MLLKGVKSRCDPALRESKADGFAGLCLDPAQPKLETGGKMGVRGGVRPTHTHFARFL
jgi:hypothetical protein